MLAEERVLLSEPVPVTTSSEPNIFPQRWLEKPILASGKELDKAKCVRVGPVIERALAKYPKLVLDAHLKHVYVLSELKYSGVSAGGTNSRTAVYLKIGDNDALYSNAWIERTFHAEFSSILMRNRARDSDSEAWQKLNPVDFRYLGSGVDAIKQRKHGQQMDEKLHALGFLKEYSQSTLENDFNAFAASLFGGDEYIWTLSEKHPPIAGKLKLTIAFYQALDPTLTEETFRRFVLEESR